MSQHPSEIVEQALTNLEAGEKALIKRAADMLQVYDGAIYGFDLLACAAIDRSIAVSAGFRTMIRDQNFICAGALLRLQLDTALRIFAGFIVDKPHDFATEVFKGTHVRNMKDGTGQRMTDHYLVTELAKEYPGIESTYQKASGYVHLSDAHFFQVLSIGDPGDQLDLNITIGSYKKQIPDTAYLDIIKAFGNSTKVTMKYIDGWIFTKDNPEKVAELRAMRDSASRDAQ